MQIDVTEKKVPEIPTAVYCDETHGLMICMNGQFFSVNDTQTALFKCCTKCVKYSNGFSMDSAGRLSKHELFYSSSWS